MLSLLAFVRGKAILFFFPYRPAGLLMGSRSRGNQVDERNLDVFVRFSMDTEIVSDRRAPLKSVCAPAI